MRIALISDIHGNLVALDAVLANLSSEGVDSIVFLGDAATLGPQPKEVLARLREIDCDCITGNHESALLDPEHATDFHIGPELHPTLRWCADQLEPEDWEFLKSFRPVLEIPREPEAGLLCFHGSPLSNTDLILPTTSGEVLDKLFAGQSATILVGGHSHVQMLRPHEGKLFLNPGSVGNVFLRPHAPGTVPTLLPWAEYALATWNEGILSVDLRRVPFDVEQLSRAIAKSDIPTRSWLLEQYSP